MKATSIQFLLALCLFVLVSANRVYVHPFSLFAYDNYSCDNVPPTHQPIKAIKPTHNEATQQDTLVPLEPDLQNQKQKSLVLAELQDVLGLRFYNTLRQQKPPYMLFSPSNAFRTLVTLYQGASNLTADSLQKLLGLEPDKQCELPFDGRKVLRTLGSIMEGDQIHMQNWAFTSSGNNLSEEFLQGLQALPGTVHVQAVDFSQPEQARTQLNTVIHETTAGKSQPMFESVDPSADLQFASALHFKGNLAASHVMPQQFWIDKDTSVTIPHVTQRGNYHYLHDTAGQYSVVKLPVQPKKPYILLVVPHEGSSLEHTESQLSTELILKWNQHLKEGFLEVTLPKFSLKTVSNLKHVLADLKLPFLLDKGAEFGRLGSKENFHVDQVLNEAGFEISEETDGQGPTLQDEEPLKIMVNRPFLFAVLEEKTKAILLLGRISNPTL